MLLNELKGKDIVELIASGKEKLASVPGVGAGGGGGAVAIPSSGGGAAPLASEDKEEKKKDYYLSERRYGSFERRFSVPEGVDTNKIEASFKKGVLTVTLPKTTEAKAAEKKISIKAA